MRFRTCICTNLHESFNYWTISIQYKHSVTIAYVNFCKAFDTVSHNKLFARLASYRIRGNLLQWLCYFLTNVHTKLEWGLHCHPWWNRAVNVSDIHK